MIVIADDLTGAAEIGGIALRFNLTVEISSFVNPESKAGLQIINTNSRSLPEKEAVESIKSVYTEIAKMPKTFVYIKTDSVLRGHISVELSSALETLNLERALLVPANPSLGRRIIDGKYYIGNIPLNETDFSCDPEFPIYSADVKEILGNKNNVSVAKPDSGLSESTGIVVGDAAKEADLQKWAEFHKENILFAGGSGFFNALLKQQYCQFTKRCREHVEIRYPVLYICGSAFNESIEWINKISEKGYPVIYYADNSDEELLSSEISGMLKNKSRAVFAVQDIMNANPEKIRKDMANVITKVFEKTEDIAELIIEGGATASEILNRLGVETLSPVQEISPGVIRCMATQFNKKLITLKPGSYPWPPELWKF